MSVPGFTVWFTGLPCSGKTTIAEIVAKRIQAECGKIEILDGDVVRTNLSKGLGFSREDRETNLNRIAFVCALLTRNGVPNIAAAISPFQNCRDFARDLIGNYVEAYARCPVEKCIERDVKGMYKKALAGEIKGFTGVDDPFDEPIDPEIICDTDKETVEESADRVIAYLRENGYLPKAPAEAPAAG
ncbi:MAG: adenylyl-sulfate kinase [Gemmatimonadota bacterium]|jgi:adenylyl-sulfate kinase|nr:adenylyl-sulfate kinase [Gemmatimonadota bacterium]MDP6529264.1 adenylyl-sulfate kinase [Gemmatimonadota bacterium]MDP6801743.1 adenylyl-sulfate kinase [Gemmatimonadota bacterium]MDP7031181.1 adenylyl-sulfate kinase [Gemmatimonadota bacterium]